jgi:hypothetical protein
MYRFDRRAINERTRRAWDIARVIYCTLSLEAKRKAAFVGMLQSGRTPIHVLP